MCTLRAIGTSAFDIDKFLSKSPFTPSNVWHYGEPRWKISQPRGRKLDTTGANFTVSEGSWQDLRAQVSDAIRYLRKHRAELGRLKKTPGLKNLVLDFPVEVKKEVWEGDATQGILFPLALLDIASALGIEIKTTIYTGQNSGK